MKNFIQEGKTVKFTTDKMVLSGEAIMVGDICLVATDAFGDGEEAVFQTEGVFELPKSTTENDVFARFESVSIKDGLVVKFDQKLKKAGVTWEEVKKSDCKKIKIKIN